MPFEARSLRVQLPCGPVTVVERERYAAEVVAGRATAWGNMLTPADEDCSDCGTGTSCGFRSGETDLERICRGTDPLDVRVLVDATVLPVLREQLAARLQELDAAQEAVDRMMET